jgi:hypothetical protein
MAQRALFLKQLDDNLNIFPPGTEHKKDEWIAKLQNTLSDSIHNIRMRLQEAGFPGFTERDPSPMKREWRMHEVQGILHDIFNRRAPQLFEHIMDAITEPGQSRDLYRSPNAEYSTLSHEGT